MAIRRYALLIGINDYESRAIPALRFAERDATTLAALLESRCGFHTQCLTGTTATCENILEALQAGGPANNWPRLEPGDQFLFFFAGHGELIDRSYFIHPYDAQAAEDTYSIQVRSLIRRIERNLGSTECMCIFDACRNLPVRGARGGTATMDAGVTRDIRAICNESERHTEILFGCGEGEQSHEDPQLQHGILTYHLQKVLETRDFAGRGGLTFDELANRTGALIGRWAQANPRGIRQRPQLERPTNDHNIVLVEPVLADGPGRVAAAPPAQTVAAGRRTPLEADQLDYGTYLAVKDDPAKVEKFLQKGSVERLDRWRRAAEAGSPEGAWLLGQLYERGLGIDRNLTTAFGYYRSAADAGLAAAQSKLGVFYAKGLGTEENMIEAVAWLRRAAEAGDANAQFNLGSCYYGGSGLPRSRSEAVQWYRKAAEQGHAAAQNQLVLCYRNGEGVTQDNEESRAWLAKAAESRGTPAESESRASLEQAAGTPAGQHRPPLPDPALDAAYRNYFDRPRETIKDSLHRRGTANEPFPHHPDLLVADCRRIIMSREFNHTFTALLFSSFHARLKISLTALEKWAFFYPEYRADFINLWNQSAGVLANKKVDIDHFEQPGIKNMYLFPGTGESPEAQSRIKNELPGPKEHAAVQSNINAQRQSAAEPPPGPSTPCAPVVAPQAQTVADGRRAALEAAQLDYGTYRAMKESPAKVEKFFQEGSVARLDRWRGAADAGSPEGAWLLGQLYERGLGVDRNLTTAFGCYRSAADAGVAPAQSKLGVYYAAGIGTEKNSAEAIAWLRKAAEAGDANAQFNLGNLYYGGSGVPRSYSEAVQWYGKAAKQGHSGAQSRLRQHYLQGAPPEADARFYAATELETAEPPGKPQQPPPSPAPPQTQPTPIGENNTYNLLELVLLMRQQMLKGSSHQQFSTLVRKTDDGRYERLETEGIDENKLKMLTKVNPVDELAAELSRLRYSGTKPDPRLQQEILALVRDATHHRFAWWRRPVLYFSVAITIGLGIALYSFNHVIAYVFFFLSGCYIFSWVDDKAKQSHFIDGIINTFGDSP